MRVLRIYHGGRDSSHRGRERALVAAGADVTLIVPSIWSDTDDAPLNDEPFNVVDLPVARPGDVNRHRYLDPAAVAETIRQFNPDVVDLHEEPFSAVTHQILATLPPGMPVVGYSAQNLDKRYPPPFSGWERNALGRFSGIYPCSRQAASVVRGKGFGGRVTVLPLGFDPAVFRPGDQQHDAAEFRLAVIGRMVPEKGIRDAIHTVAEVQRRRPAHLHLVGSGPELAQVPSYCEEVGLSEGVMSQQWTDAAEIAAIYRASHLVLVPSSSTERWVEQFGRVVVEAQASGAVVAGYASGTIPEVAAGAAWLAAPDDRVGLARAAAGLAEDAGRWDELRDLGIAAAANKKWDVVAEHQLDFYAAALAVRPGTITRASARTRAGAAAEFGPPAITGNGQVKPFALPLLRESAAVGRVGGALLDLVARRL